MKHIRRISLDRLVPADAYSDLLNALWQAWLDFVYNKKNAIVTPTS